MSIINVPVGPPYGAISLNTVSVCAAVPHQAAPDMTTDMLIDTSGVVCRLSS